MALLPINLMYFVLINNTLSTINNYLYPPTNNILMDTIVNHLNFSMPTPWDIETIQPKLVFYRNYNKEFTVEYNMEPKTVAIQLNESEMLNTERLTLITHGFHNNFDTDWLHNYKDKILNLNNDKIKDKTVAILGWGNGADILVFRYRQAAANVLTVGNWLAKYVKMIKDVKPDIKLYGIGHSLGAHVFGVAGRVSKSFDRITGLDPAGPCFEKVPDSQTLRASDAKYVDIIHTDGYDSKLDPSEWFFPVNHYGSLVPIGTIDFYPNFGYHQPGAGTFTVAGSHLRALQLFEWSITNKGKFITDQVLIKKPDFDEPVDGNTSSKYKTEMGYWSDQWCVPPLNANTLFYLKTNKQEPWV